VPTVKTPTAEVFRSGAAVLPNGDVLVFGDDNLQLARKREVSHSPLAERDIWRRGREPVRRRRCGPTEGHSWDLRLTVKG